MTTTDRIRTLIAAGHTTGDAARKLGLDVSDDHDGDVDVGLAVLLPGWSADDGNWTVTYPEADSGVAAAEAYVDDSDMDLSGGSIRVSVRAWRVGLAIDDDGEVCEVQALSETHFVVLDPPEPKCAGGHEHTWESPHEVVGGCERNPGVYASGGAGVVVTEVCRHCGSYRVTDSWTIDRQSGQPYDGVRYRDADDRSLEWVRDQAEDEET